MLTPYKNAQSKSQHGLSTAYFTKNHAFTLLFYSVEQSKVGKDFDWNGHLFSLPLCLQPYWGSGCNCVCVFKKGLKSIPRENIKAECLK